jgi:hypothetical protein
VLFDHVDLVTQWSCERCDQGIAVAAIAVATLGLVV